MRSALIRLRDKLGSDPAYFQRVYNYTFDFARVDGQRSLRSNLKVLPVAYRPFVLTISLCFFYISIIVVFFALFYEQAQPSTQRRRSGHCFCLADLRVVR